MKVLTGRRPEEFGFKFILYEKRERVARVTLNRPEAYNAYTTEMLEEMRQAFVDASLDDGVGVLVLTGAGDKAFCTGGDVKEYADRYVKRPHDYWKYMGYFSGAIEALKNCGKPTIARVNGMAVGGGNEFNLACDLAIAAEHAKFRQVGVRVGSVACGGATQWLPLVIGDRRAREMLYLCEEVDAKKALEWGLVNEVVPYAELDAAVDRWCQKLLDKFPECLRYTKAQVNFWKDLVWHLTVGHARDWLALHFTDLEPYEGMTAFVEKRAPRYREIREMLARGEAGETLWGPPRKKCAKCGAKGMPERFAHCGLCGAPLTDEGR
jgi:enoyl-CoA hydratase/carnithine racemase